MPGAGNTCRRMSQDRSEIPLRFGTRAVLPSAILASSGNWMRGTVPLSPALPGWTVLHIRTHSKSKCHATLNSLLLSSKNDQWV